MGSLIAAVLFFVGIHLLVSGTRLRGALVQRLGERPYQGLFSLASLLGLVWMIRAYIQVRVVTPTALPESRWLAGALVLVGLVFVVLGLLAKSPTAVGGESALDDPEPARGIHRVTRHPFLFGIGLWAAVHMVFNPQPASLWFFGAFLALALAGPRAIDAKRAARFGEKWQRYAEKTSALPFLAIVQGRNRLALGELGLVKLAVALGVFGILLALHARLFGMPAI